MSDCGRCNATGKEIRLTKVSAQAGAPGAVTCTHCQGHGKVTRAGEGSPRGSRVCFLCDGSGWVLEVSQEVDCHTCHATGQRPDYERGMVIARENRCDHMSKRFVRDWVEDCELHVVRRQGGQTFAEANLGVGLWSCTDYGAAWKGDNEDIARKVLVDIVERPSQFIKIIDKETSVVGNVIVILLNRSGYSVMVQGASTGLGGLPETYTPEVLLREVV